MEQVLTTTEMFRNMSRQNKYFSIDHL